MDLFKQCILQQEEKTKRNNYWRRVFNSLILKGGGFEQFKNGLDFNTNPPDALIAHEKDREILIDRFFYDESHCENTIHPINIQEHKNTLVFREDLQASIQRWNDAHQSKLERQDVPDIQKLRSWVNVLNRHQYGYNTDHFAHDLIVENNNDMVDAYDITVSKTSNIFRIVSYNVHAFLNSFTCILSNNQFNRPLNSGRSIALFMQQLLPDIICFQEFTALAQNNKLWLHQFSRVFNEINPTLQITDQYITQGAEEMPNFLGVATMILNNIPNQDPMVGRFQRSNITKPYDELYRSFLSIDIKIKNTFIRLWNIHPEADGFSKTDKEEQLMYIFQYCDQNRDKPMIIVGDYNTANIQPFILNTTFVQIKQIDKTYWKNKHKKMYTAWNGSYIDHLCVNRAFLDMFGYPTVYILPVDLSDHFPIMIDIYT